MGFPEREILTAVTLKMPWESGHLFLELLTIKDTTYNLQPKTHNPQPTTHNPQLTTHNPPKPSSKTAAVQALYVANACQTPYKYFAQRLFLFR